MMHDTYIVKRNSYLKFNRAFGVDESHSGIRCHLPLPHAHAHTQFHKTLSGYSAVRCPKITEYEEFASGLLATPKQRERCAHCISLTVTSNCCSPKLKSDLTGRNANFRKVIRLAEFKKKKIPLT